MTLTAAQYVPPVRTPCTPLDLAQAIETGFGGDGHVPAGMIAVLMAHNVLEGGRDVAAGTVLNSLFNHDCGNIKAGDSWTGKFTAIRLNEYLPVNGTRTLIYFSPNGEEIGGMREKLGPIKPGTEHAVPLGHPQCRMRAFDSLAAGIANKNAFLNQPRFAKALAYARAGDASNYVLELATEKYFTASVDAYRRGVVSLAKTYDAIAHKTADTPIVLSPAEEGLIDACTGECSRSIWNIDAHLFDLSQTWGDQLQADRDAAVKGSE